MPLAWDIAALLRGLCQDLTEPWPDLLPALLAAINDPAQAAALEPYAPWRGAAEMPPDAPWPGTGAAGRPETT